MKKIIFEETFTKKLLILHQHFTLHEVMGLLLGNIDKEGNIAINDIGLIDQINSSAHVELDNDALMKYILANQDKTILGYWHTHPSFSASPSPTDFLNLHKFVMISELKGDSKLALMFITTRNSNYNKKRFHAESLCTTDIDFTFHITITHNGFTVVEQLNDVIKVNSKVWQYNQIKPKETLKQRKDFATHFNKFKPKEKPKELTNQEKKALKKKRKKEWKEKARQPIDEANSAVVFNLDEDEEELMAMFDNTWCRSYKECPEFEINQWASGCLHFYGCALKVSFNYNG